LNFLAKGLYGTINSIDGQNPNSHISKAQQGDEEVKIRVNRGDCDIDVPTHLSTKIGSFIKQISVGVTDHYYKFKD